MNNRTFQEVEPEKLNRNFKRQTIPVPFWELLHIFEEKNSKITEAMPICIYIYIFFFYFVIKFDYEKALNQMN